MASLPESVPFLGTVSHFLQLVLGAACQDQPSRALAPFGHALAVCARCTGLYLGLALGAVLMWPRMRAPVTWACLGCGLFLMALDVATETVGLRPPHAWLRLLTGLQVSYPAALIALAAYPKEQTATRRRPLP